MIRAAVISCRFPARRTRPSASCARWRQPTIDHRGPEFAALGREVLDGLKTVFQTSSPVVIYPASGSGAWEASLVNTLSPGDAVLAFDIGEFSKNWAEVARRLGLDVEIVPGTWRRGVDPDELGERLARDRDHRIKAVLVVHNETSTGVTSRLPEIRRAIDAAGIRRCCSSMRCRRSARSICATTSGASTSRSPDRRRA